MNRMSVATIDAPEFINITSVNPLISECEIKVLYLGANRNRSYIDKNAATAIGKTLPGSPIVGYYKKDKKDFADHGEQIIFDDEGMKVNDLTRPYGFVPTDAKVWFQNFIDTDEFGNQTERTYLMTVGYLWTGQYEEAQKVYESTSGNPQSMKLKDDETLKGHWSEDIKTGVEFFIINDAIIQNLCILGEDVEPCFEGADVTAPKLSANFSKDNNFVVTLFTMMKDLNEMLKNKEGGYSMDNQNTPVVEEGLSTENFSNEQDNSIENVIVENQSNTEEFAKSSEEDKKKEEENSQEDSNSDAEKEDKEKDEEDKKKSVAENALKDDEEDKKDDKEDDDKADDDDDKEEAKKKYELLEQQFTELQSNYANLEKSYKELVEFKNAIDAEKKDALINQFYMLSDEDKKDVIENKSNYSLDEIEAKLSIICVRKKVNFDLDSDNNSNVEDTAPVTYNLNSGEADNLPAWLKAVETTRSRNQ